MPHSGQTQHQAATHAKREHDFGAGHAPWIDAVRATLPGRLVLGTTFNWPDLPAYAVGIALGTLAEWRWRGHA